MKYIITSGPMESEIDKVRKIQNSSSGKLGCEFVTQLHARGMTEIVYIHTPRALVPANVRTVLINDHNQLLSALEAEITGDSAIIHAMAISDFNIKGTASIDLMAKTVFEQLAEVNDQNDIIKIIRHTVEKQDKLASDVDQLVVMEKAIKIIDQIKLINPMCKLVGFKLLSNVSDERLIEVATNIKLRANCDYVVANKKEEVTEFEHRALIVGTENVIEVNDKVQIANQIIDLLEGK